MTSRRLAVKNPAEPSTDSATKLRAWLEIPPGRRQADLAAACSVSQQTISDYKRRAARPDPGSELARLIETATSGFVLAAGWLTTSELRRRERNQTRAAAFARGANHAAEQAVAVETACASTPTRVQSRADNSPRSGRSSRTSRASGVAVGPTGASSRASRSQARGEAKGTRMRAVGTTKAAVARALRGLT